MKRKTVFIRWLVFVPLAFAAACSEDGPSFSPSTGNPPPGGTGGSGPAAPATLSITGIEPNTNVGLAAGETVTIRGEGFHPSASFSMGDVVLTVFDVSSSEAKFVYLPSLFADGPATIGVRNPDGQQASVTDGFFRFASPLWRSTPGFLDAAVHDIDPAGSDVDLATGYGPQAWKTDHFEAGTGLEFCGPSSAQVYGSCPTCFTEALPACFLTHQVAQSLSTNEIYVLAEERSGAPRKLIFSTDSVSWEDVDTAGSNPLALRATSSAVYLLNDGGVSSLAPSGWGVFVPLSDNLRTVIQSDGVSHSDFVLEAYEDGDDVYLIVGTPRGLFQASYRFSNQTASPWLLSGPLAGPRITDLAVDHALGLVYFSYTPHDLIPVSGNNAVGKLSIGSLGWTTFAPIPHVYDLALAEGTLLAAGWSPAAVGQDSILYRIAPGGSVSHLYSRSKTLGFPPLPSSVGDAVTAIAYEDGSFYASLKARRCLLKLDGVPTANPAPAGACLGKDENLFQDIESLLKESLRPDLHLGNIPHLDGIEGLPLTCALEIPEKNLFFACTPERVYVSYRHDRWRALEWDAPIVSLAHEPGAAFLYGASAAQGVFTLPLK